MKKSSFCLGALGTLAILLTVAEAKVLINAAGATFPYPIYGKWFEEFAKADPDAQINYQSIGSGGGIRQFTEGTVDFGASDMPMTDEQIGKFKSQPAAFSHGAGRAGAHLQHPRRHPGLEVHARGAGGNLPGQDQEVERCRVGRRPTRA